MTVQRPPQATSGTTRRFRRPTSFGWNPRCARRASTIAASPGTRRGSSAGMAASVHEVEAWATLLRVSAASLVQRVPPVERARLRRVQVERPLPDLPAPVRDLRGHVQEREPARAPLRTLRARAGAIPRAPASPAKGAPTTGDGRVNDGPPSGAAIDGRRRARPAASSAPTQTGATRPAPSCRRTPCRPERA